MKRILAAFGASLLALLVILAPGSAQALDIAPIIPDALASALPTPLPTVLPSQSASPTQSPSPTRTDRPIPVPPHVTLPPQVPTSIPKPPKPIVVPTVIISPVPFPVPVPTPVPGPVETIIQRVPGPTRTVVKVVRVVEIRQLPPERVIVTQPPRIIRETVLASPRVVVSPSPYPVPGKDRITVPEAITYSAVALLVGFLLGLLALFLAYGVGFKNAEMAEGQQWRKVRRDLFNK